MAVNLVVNGVGYPYPQTGDQPPWGDAMTNWASAVTTGMLQKAGGNFALTSDVNFGASKGLISVYFTSRSANAAASGAVRLAVADAVKWRNNANDGDVALGINDSDQLTFEGATFLTTTGTIAASKALVTDSSGNIVSAASTTNTQIDYLASAGSNVHGDSDAATLTNKTINAPDNTITNISNANISASASISYGKLNLTGLISNGDISGSAAIAWSKLVHGTGNQVVVTDGGGVVTSEAQLAKSRGGAGADMSSVTFPSSGTIATTVGTHEVWVDSGNGHGSTNNKIRRFTNARTNTGTAITYADSATNGATFTINEAGLYSVSYTDFLSSASCQFGVSLNSTQLTTSISTITATDQVIRTTGAGANNVSACSVVLRLAVNDVVRAHTDGTPDGTSTGVKFRIIKIAA